MLLFRETMGGFEDIRTFDTGHWILDIGYWILYNGYWILDIGYGYWISDIEN